MTSETTMKRWIIEDLLRCYAGQSIRVVITPSAKVNAKYLNDYGHVAGATFWRSGERGVFVRLDGVVRSNPMGPKIMYENETSLYQMGASVTFTVDGYDLPLKMQDVFGGCVEVWSSGVGFAPRNYDDYLVTYRGMPFLSIESRLRQLMMEVSGDAHETLRLVSAGKTARIKHLLERNRLLLKNLNEPKEAEYPGAQSPTRAGSAAAAAASAAPTPPRASGSPSGGSATLTPKSTGAASKRSPIRPPKNSQRDRAWNQRQEELAPGGVVSKILQRYDGACISAMLDFYGNGGFRSPYEPLIDPTPFIDEMRGTWTWDSTGIALGEESQKKYRLSAALKKDALRFDQIVKLRRLSNTHHLTGPALMKGLGAMSIGGGKMANLESVASKAMLNRDAVWLWIKQNQPSFERDQLESIRQSPIVSCAVDNDQEFIRNAKGTSMRIRMMTNVNFFREREVILPIGSIVVFNGRTVRIEGVQELDPGHIWAVYDIRVLSVFTAGRLGLAAEQPPVGSDMGVMEMPDAMFAKDFAIIDVPGLPPQPKRRPITDFLGDGGTDLVPAPLNFPRARKDGLPAAVFGFDVGVGGDAMTVTEHLKNLDLCKVMQRMRRHATLALWERNDINEKELFSADDDFIVINAQVVPAAEHLEKVAAFVAFVNSPEVKEVISRYSTYQRKVVDAWNPRNMDRTLTMTVTPMNYNETTAIGGECVGIEFLLRAGAIEWADSTKKTLRPGRSRRFMNMYGDHLTCAQLRKIIPNMIEKLGSTATAANAKVILNAVLAVFEFSGDLHNAVRLILNHSNVRVDNHLILIHNHNNNNNNNNNNNHPDAFFG
jgi:hypothetical protein